MDKHATYSYRVIYTAYGPIRIDTPDKPHANWGFGSLLTVLILLTGLIYLIAH